MNVRIILLVIAVIVSACAEQTIRPRLSIPNATWEPIYFTSIDRAAQHAGLPDLRHQGLPGGDVELRVWEGFGGTRLQAYVLRRRDGSWTATYIREGSGQRSRRPAVDVGGIWGQLVDGGLFTIRDDSERRHCAVILDGVGYVVEIANENVYRTYLVSNPESQRSEDGDRLLHLLPILYGAFGETSRPDPSNLPSGETKIVSSVVSEVPMDVSGQPSSPWRSAVGAVAERKAEVRLMPQDALAQGRDLRTPPCQEMPPYVWKLHLTGDVALELLIEPDGKVSAARTLSGHPILRQASVEAALKWTFAPISGSSQLRGTVLTIRYKEEWVPFPWLKRVATPSNRPLQPTSGGKSEVE